MKLDKGTKILYAILITIAIYSIVSHLYRINVKKHSIKCYAIGYIYDYISLKGSSHPGKYYYYINKSQYKGSTSDNGDRNLKKYFIVEVLKEKPGWSDIKIEIPINPSNLIPQPPEGWNECPINEDGTIKDKYKRRDKNGNVIKSKSVPKPSQKKKNSKLDEDIEREAMKLLMENKK